MTTQQVNVSQVLHAKDKFREYPMRYLQAFLFGMLSFVNGMCWVVTTSVSVPVARAYDVSSTLVALIPTSYMICYLFVNIPSNWVLDEKGIRKGIIIGAVLTALGSGIRCFINKGFMFVLLGQLFCAIAQPFILNAPIKIAAKWFLPKNREMASAILSVSNIIGSAFGFVAPSLFLSDANDDVNVRESIRILMIFEFGLCALVAVACVAFSRQRPPSPPSPSSAVQATQYFEGMRNLASSSSFWLLFISFSCVNGALNFFGSLMGDLFSPYNYNEDQISQVATALVLVGIVGAGLAGAYLQRTLNYSLLFKVLAVVGCLQGATMVLALIYQPSSIILLIGVFAFAGLAMTPLLPISFSYGCEIMFPIGEAQITGFLMSGGQLLGIIEILLAQFVFGVGSKATSSDGSFKVICFVNATLIIGYLIYATFNGKLKRSQMQRDVPSSETGNDL